MSSQNPSTVGQKWNCSSVPKVHVITSLRVELCAHPTNARRKIKPSKAGGTGSPIETVLNARAIKRHNQIARKKFAIVSLTVDTSKSARWPENNPPEESRGFRRSTQTLPICYPQISHLFRDVAFPLSSAMPVIFVL